MRAKKEKTHFPGGREKRRKWRAEIDGSICIDFLEGIHLYLWKNTHERKGKIKTGREKEGERGRHEERERRGKYCH